MADIFPASIVAMKGVSVTPIAGPRKPKRDKSLAQISLLGAVPAILIAAPAVGFFVGRWADEKFHTEPWLLIAGLVLGFVAAAREIYNLARRAQQLDEEDDNTKSGH